MSLVKTTRVNFLFDFYQSLLTEKQRTYMRLYYLEDYSLGEIAGEYGVSRQAIYDNVRRTEAMLEDYELKLKLFSTFQKRMDIIKDIENLITDQTEQSDMIQKLLLALKNNE